ncbi:insulin receptor substrate 1 isoform X3 [Tribolium madens]|uniref:insulin receptor substrate 1 isoform X3 n=1 Tax=Tribolium madens TaxID=41895 RepID=UPI001CF753D9|nr:insulin receptor substrate 1 isoform X3 [Tribolium madens]
MMSGSEGGGGVVLSGYLKKLKTSRKKFFVLRAETADASARLEYYDTAKKFNSGLPPKRSIPLKNCFNINKRLDTKHKHVIALYTKDDCFCVVLDNDDDLDSWLKALLKLQHGEEVVDGETPKPTFEHVWQVTVLNRGLGNAGLTGNYRLCLTDKTLSLIKRDCEKPTIELNLSNIRSCGNLRDFFFLEIGRSSTLGAGELWMQTEDNNIAQNVHSTVFHAMTTNSSNKDEFGPKSRNRSSSATESSKPNMTRKIHTNIAPKCHILLPVSGVASFYQHLIQRGTKASERRHSISAGSLTHCGVISHQRTQSLPLANPAPLSDHSHSRKRPKCMSRERCDSMPSRARTTSEGGNHRHLNPYRPASLYGRDISHSPPLGSPVSPPCSTDSAGSSYSLTDETDVCTELEPSLGRYGHSLTPDEAIAEEDCPDSPPYNNYISMTLHSSDDGYVDMSPRGRHHNSPTASMSSVTSGTPSTDMRFAEYPLEKVTSYLAEDDGRPARAYSVGSKPESYRKYTEKLGNNDNLRERAMSVGSKTKKLPARVLPPHGYHHQGTKSSSAPILTNSRGQGSYGSIGPMDDLMEMDFSHNSGYMDMKPVNTGYVEMKPGRKPETSPYVDMSSGSSPAKPSFISSPTPQSDVYMEMDPRKNHNEYLAMSFKKMPSPGGSPGTPEGYVEMSLGRGHSLTEDYANMSLNNTKKRTNRNKNRSEPINIQNSQRGGPNPRSILLARKHSTGTPPTMYLPLTVATPHDSKDSSSSSINTPSSSSTIFPISLNSPSLKATPDYIPMDFDKSDYVNYDPKPGGEESRPINNENNDDEGRAYEVLRPSSSESCSTIGGSRPASVTSAHMHYASLDLDEGNRSPRTVKGSGGEQGEVTLTYAAIDFVKSEGLKHNSVAATTTTTTTTNAKVKH